MPLEGKTALVTGAGSGIGAAIAQRFAAAGAVVYVTDVDEAAARAVAADLDGRGRPLRLDVCREADCRAALDAVQDQGGPVDVLVNNAGIGLVGTLLETTPEDFDRVYAVNVRGVFNVTRAFLPGMLARKSGVVLNVASVGGLVGLRDRLAYAASKFAVVGMTKSMALDHAADGIRVNCICPARVETPFVRARLQEYPDPEAAYRELSATQAVGRMARPEEIADAALYLARDEAAFVTGSTLVIDGGFTAGK